MTVQRVKVVQSLFHANDQAAEAIRTRCDEAGVVAVNLLAGPGAGKTSLITRTIAALAGVARVGVVEGDIAGSVDTERVLAAGAVDAVQVNTGGGCHLEAGMLARALDDLDLGAIDLLMVENVGNLICPTHWDLGEHARVCLVSAAEGDDKPVKYPDVFARSDAIVLNKIDLIDWSTSTERASTRRSARSTPMRRSSRSRAAPVPGSRLGSTGSGRAWRRGSRVERLAEMCIPLVARVRSVGDGVAEVELIEGEVVQVSTALFPDVAVDEHVLLDRGLIIEVVTPEEAERLLSFFADLASLWEEEDARA